MLVLDLCSGIGGFALGAKKNDWDILGFSEIDKYASKVLDNKFDRDNFHDIYDVAVPEIQTSYAHMLDEDLVPCEELGHSTVTMEDFLEGVLEYPDVLCCGSPCQDVTPASLTSGTGIHGKKSNAIEPVMDLIEDLEPKYFVLENSSNITSRGLCEIISRLNSIGYVCEWEIISAAHFGFNHYRHRCFLVAYRKELECGRRLFDAVAAMAWKTPDDRFPLVKQWPDDLLKNTFVENPKLIKNRQARIMGLGNAVIPDIAYAIFRAIDLHYGSHQIADQRVHNPKEFKRLVDFKTITTKKGHTFTVMPKRGMAISGKVKALDQCPILNPSNREYAFMTSTLLGADRKNNFTTRSRATRPGGLGGLVGSLMKMGVNEGALCPTFAEQYMGFPIGHTLLP